MGKVRVHIAVSADGYVAGPNQSEENPLGEGGESLHDWVVALSAWRELHGMEGGEVNASNAVIKEAQANVGAEIMGRGKFGGGPGPWGDDPWRGWWGEDPPFHMPVFVLTHHEREPLTLSDTTFTFVTDGIESALEQARAAAAPTSSTSTWRPGSSTSSSSASCRSCSAAVPGFSPESGRISSWSRSGRSRRPA